MNGLSPSPQVEMKFSSQAHDPVKGNDLIHSALGSNATSWHREFKKFFCVRDPCMVTLTKTTHPNFKVDRLFKHVITVSIEAWLLGMEFSCDDMTQGLQGNHGDKRSITYKP